VKGSATDLPTPRRPPRSRLASFGIHDNGLARVVTGHVSLAYAARARWPRAELVALVVAAMLPDLADFVLPKGRECRTPCEMYTHAFPAVLVLTVAMAALAWGIWHRRVTALLAGAMVLLHVVFDFATGFKPFWFGGPSEGFNLYRFQAVDFAIESAMMTLAWVILRRSPSAPRWAVHPVTLGVLVTIQAAFDIWQYRMFGHR